MSYVPDNDDRRLTRPPAVNVSGSSSVQWLSFHDKPRRVKKQPLGFSPPPLKVKSRRKSP